jgi:pyridoxamine 5'-phosphate oxidase
VFEDELDADPIAQFDAWYREAGTDAVALVTASAGGAPSGRMVLLKGHDERGFAFYTNFDSAKGRDLAENPRAALVFHWPPGRQVRVTGPVNRVSQEESEAYWRNRPRASQLSAWASRQSEVVESRHVLEVRVAELAEQFPGEVPSPPFWGGYRVEPAVIEFWQGRENRLHDRLKYRHSDDGGWRRERLQP